MTSSGRSSRRSDLTPRCPSKTGPSPGARPRADERGAAVDRRPRGGERGPRTAPGGRGRSSSPAGRGPARTGGDRALASVVGILAQLADHPPAPRHRGHLALARAPAADAVRPPRLRGKALPCAPVPGSDDAQDVLRAAEQEHELAREVLTDGGRVSPAASGTVHIPARTDDELVALESKLVWIFG